MTVNVFVSGNLAGVISRSEQEPDTFLFTYDVSCKKDGAVSLTMPVMSDQYDSMGTVHPIFEMNLPEGALRHKLELMFSKAIKDFDSLSLLELTGKSQIGRLRYATEGAMPDEVPPESVQRLLAYQGAEDLFDDLLNRFARYSGISGMQPKVLIRDDAGALDRITNKGATHIVKSFNPHEYFELAANEFFSMQAARYAGLPTAKTHLSENRKMLVVERFDLMPDGNYSGFEDFCVLSGMRASGRYNSSYEALAQKISSYVSPEHYTESMLHYFGTVSLACAIKNGDAHLKNFGILYEKQGESVRLAPVFDMVSTAPYFPHEALALELNGSKQFPTRRQLVQFGRQACGLSSRQVEHMLANIAQGVDRAAREMQGYTQEHPDFKSTANHLTKVFARGIAHLTAPKSGIR
ncbi:MAG: type II toxin-antitoxin system HipA family toxin [Sulfuricellaceae bacterium]|nr:type II toxin-antitoxin system HipA family toxin [Sulfuricellaceae bacterium]